MHNKKRLLMVSVAVYLCLSIFVVVFLARDRRQDVNPELEAALSIGAEVVQESDTEELDDSEKSFLQLYDLPPLARMSEEDTGTLIAPLQVMKKISKLGLTDEDLLYPMQNYEALYDSFEGVGNEKPNTVSFDGSNASELNKFMAENAGKKIEINSKEIEVDTAILVPNDTQLYARQTRLTGERDVAIELTNATDVTISGFVIDAGFGYGIYSIDSRNIVISDCTICEMTHKPVVFMGECDVIVLRDNRMEGNLEGGAYFNGKISNVLMERNRILDNYGTSNWMAGVVITAIDIKDKGDVYALFRKDLHFPKEQRLDSMLEAPHNFVLKENYVCGNNSSGIYCDGPYKVFIVDNRIQGNDKEGMCLDYGTIGAFVSDNKIVGNGKRGRQSDEDLKMDFVLEAGRLEDGSSCSKLPGVSIDNSAYNIVYNNMIEKNYGGGVKMVRTGIRNIISTNIINDNNQGQGDVFHFFGIELGAALADVPAENLDFTPAYENIVCRNIITGKHYAGIFLAEDCYINDFFDNTIMDATWWSIESLSEKLNASANNYSRIKSRGIGLVAPRYIIDVAEKVE